MALLEVERVSKSFSGVQALNDVSFAVHEREIHGLIGPNGAGKTTLFNVVHGVIPASAGRVIFGGQALTGLRPHAVARLGIARTFQTVRLFGDQTALENVVIGTYRHTRAGMAGGLLQLPAVAAEQRRTRDEARACLDLVGLAAIAERYVDGLPFGQQRLVELARALALRPRLLLLDEPAAGLNDTETAELADLIAGLPDQGITVVVVEHNVPLIMSVADRITVLDHGSKLAEGVPADVRSNPQVVAAYLGTETP